MASTAIKTFTPPFTEEDIIPDVRGDKITGERYYSKEWMDAEWENVFTKVWNIGGTVADLEEPGDWICHDLAKESILMILQDDGSIKAFYNACIHRGNRLVFSDIGGGKNITCSYHAWQFGKDGVLQHAQDAEDIRGGNPCGKAKLTELKCETWGGFIWYNMDENAKPLKEWLGPLHPILEGYKMESMTRVLNLSAVVPCNWKIIRDNFNESYHLPTLHPELQSFIEDDYKDSVFQTYEDSWHNRMIMKGCQSSMRLDVPNSMQAPLDDMLRNWGLDPEKFEGRSREARPAIQKAMREQGVARGFTALDTMTDSQLTDYHHCTLWPNVSFTMSADGFQMLRTEPHPTDPEKCVFDHWYSMPEIEGRDRVFTPLDERDFEAMDKLIVNAPEESMGFVADQDISVASSQQIGLHSRGYQGGTLTKQETRIQYFHERLNDVCGFNVK